MRSRAEQIRYWIFAEGTPVTKILAVVNILTFLIVWMMPSVGIDRLLAFQSPSAFAFFHPWRFFTYGLLGHLDILGLLFSIIWLWFAGGSLERAWGSARFGIFFFAISAISALGILAGGVLTRTPVELAGLWMPLAGVTIAFAMLNPEQTILFYLVIPLKLKYLALIDVIFVFLNYAHGGNFLMGICALLGCGVSYYYVKRPNLFSGRSNNDGVIRIHPKGKSKFTFNPAKWYRDYKEQKRLRDFFNR